MSARRESLLSTRRLASLVWRYRRAIVLTVLGWQATYATLGAIASERSVLSLVALTLALTIALGIGVTARRRGAVTPMWLGVGYTLLATVVFAIAVPLGALGPVPTSDAYHALSWRCVAAVMYFALFAGVPCFALAAWSLITDSPSGGFGRHYGDPIE